MKKLVSLIFPAVLALSFSAVGNTASYSWDEMKATAGTGEKLATYAPGALVRFCLAYQGKPTCKVATKAPPEFDCVSVFDEKTGLWFNLGDIPDIRVAYGDGKETCHGRLVPTGQYWGENESYKR